MSDFNPKDEPVLIRPGGFNRKLDVRKTTVLCILLPYLQIAKTIARPKFRKQRLDWGGLWTVSDSRGGYSIAGPAIGAPNAVTMIESMIAHGAENIIVTGCCGSINSALAIGDILVPTDALSEEGTSAHYHPEVFPPKADAELNERIFEIARTMNRPIKTGTVWTTDAPYRETAAKVEQYGARGILAVEMELSALFTVARFRGAKLAAVLAVSDELASLEWKPGFFKPAFLAASANAVRIALKTAASLASSQP